VLEKIILRYSENKSEFFIKIQQVYNQITNVTIESLSNNLRRQQIQDGETRTGDKTNLAGAQSRPTEKIILRYSENESGFFIKIQQVYNQITNVTIPLSYDY
jgi:transposase